MYVCTFGGYYDRVYFRLDRHLEFETSGSGNIEGLQKFEKSFGCIYTETAFKDIQNV